jgi:ABC-type lipoprotein export system ATPase subunit
LTTIHLHHALPFAFADTPEIRSEVWRQDVVFEKGQTYLIQAQSGLGKSSLCGYIYGYRVDFSGEILFDEKDIKTFRTKDWDNIHQQHLALLFQELRLFPELTAMENILLKNNLTHLQTVAAIETMLEQLGIAAHRDRPVGKMSWGQQQRVAIIRALCQPFDFLFLDEPVSHLDDSNARIVSALVGEEVRRQGAGLITTSIGKDLPMDYSQILSL